MASKYSANEALGRAFAGLFGFPGGSLHCSEVSSELFGSNQPVVPASFARQLLRLLSVVRAAPSTLTAPSLAHAPGGKVQRRAALGVLHARDGAGLQQLRDGVRAVLRGGGGVQRRALPRVTEPELEPALQEHLPRARGAALQFG